MSNRTINYIFDKEAEFADLLLTAEQCCEDDWDELFVSNIKSRYERFAGKMCLSEKQRNWLEQIAKGVKK